MGKFKKGARVRLTEDHDVSALAGMVGTIVGKDSDGDRVVAFDNFTDGHSGGAYDGSTNHWFVPKSKLELVPPFAVGARVRLTKDNDGWGDAGDIGTVLSVDSGVNDCYVEFDHEIQGSRRWYASWSSLELVVAEPWVPKVGDRVRLVKDGLSTTGAIGKLATIEAWSDGKFIDGDQYLLNIDGPVDYETTAVTENYTRATIDCFVPVAAEAQQAAEAPTPLKIEADRYYKTRDGRKVGPMRRFSATEVICEVDGAEPGCGRRIWTLDGEHIFGIEEIDLVAEWVDEPVVAVEEITTELQIGDRVRFVEAYGNANVGDEGVVSGFWEASDNPKGGVSVNVSGRVYSCYAYRVERVAVALATAMPAKFKVGDRVKLKDPDDPDMALVASRNSDGFMSLKWDSCSSAGPEWWEDHELELAPAEPANDNNNTITLTLNIDSKPAVDTLRTIAAALSKAADEIAA